MAGNEETGADREAVSRRGEEFSVWSETFLNVLAATSNVTEAAKQAGVRKARVYEIRRRDAGFARRWQEALCEGYDHLEMALLHRLRVGELKSGGGAGKSHRSYDNANALRLLLAHRETAAKVRAERDDEDSEAVLASLNAKLDRMRQQMLDSEREEGAGDDA